MSALNDHRLSRIEAFRVQDRFPRYVVRNARGNPQAYGGGIQARVLVTDQGVRGWATSNVPDDQVTPLISERISDLFDPAMGTRRRAMGLDLALHDLAGQHGDLVSIRACTQ